MAMTAARSGPGTDGLRPDLVAGLTAAVVVVYARLSTSKPP